MSSVTRRLEQSGLQAAPYPTLGGITEQARAGLLKGQHLILVVDVIYLAQCSERENETPKTLQT
jgi:hypothetical protein